MSNESSPKCPQCGAPLPEDAPKGLCPNCLMALNLKTETVFTDDTPAAQPPLPPEQIAPHFPQLEILECLGRGGMGVVYKARQKSLNRLVALKLLAPERVRDAKFAERFAREAHALAALNHPNIVTIYDFGQAGGFYYLLMEFVDGVNLRQLLRARKFTPEEALAIVPPLCDALQFAHDRGIIHRDIKPENLLLDKVGRVKVADFGIAKMLGTVNGGGNAGESAAPENATQTAVGTPSYSAPEQKSDPQRVDSRADIYSLGVVFYEMLTGELPGKRIEPPSRKVQIDVRLDEVVLRALEKRPELRYQQVSEVKTMVETIVGSAAAPAAPVDAASTGTAGNAFDEASNAAREARALPEPHFSRTAIMGAGCFGLVLCLVFVGTIFLDFWSGTGRGVPEVLFVFWPSLELSLLIAGTILGWISVTQIRRSAGKLYGLWLAVFDGLFFPLLALDGAIGWLWLVLAKLFARQVLGLQNSLFLDLWDLTIWISLALASAALVDWLIIRAIWRAVNKGSAGVLPAEPGVAPGRAERELKRGGIVLVGRRNGQRVIVWRGVANTFFAISGCVLIASLLLRFFMPIGTEQMITFMSLTVLVTAGGVIMGFRAPIEQLTPLDDSPSGSGGRPAGYEQRRRKLAWKLLMASWACLVAVLVIKGVQWWSKYEPAGVWIPSPINGSISGEYGEAWLHVTEVSQRGQVVLMAITCETPYPDRGLFVQYSGPAFGFPADIASAETNLDSLKSPTFMSGPGGGRTLVGSDLLKGKSVYQIGFVLPDAATAAKVVEQIKRVHLGKPRGMDENKCVLDLFQLHRHVGEKNSGEPVSENLTAMLIWQPKRDSPPNPKPAAAQTFSFGPVIDTTIDMAKPGGYDLDNSRFNEVAAENMIKGPEWSQQFGNDLIVLKPDGTNIAGISDLVFVDMKPSEVEELFWQKSAGELLNHPSFTSMLKATAEQASSHKSKLWWRESRKPRDASDIPTYLFKTREGSMGILQITGSTENPRGVKIRYKLVQNGKQSTSIASEVEQNANQEIARLKLQHAEEEVKEAETKVSIGVMAQYELQRAKWFRDSAAAEVKGDDVEVARLNLAIAEQDLDVAGKKHSVGKATSQEYEQAKLDQDIAMVRYKQAQVGAGRLPVTPANAASLSSEPAWSEGIDRRKKLQIARMNEMRSFLIAAHMFADRHDGRWPEQLAQIRSDLPALLAQTVEHDFVYCCPAISNKTEMASQGVLFEKVPVNPAGHVVGFGDGHIEFISDPSRFKAVGPPTDYLGNAEIIQDRLPQLRFVAWQDEWKTNQPGAARHPDGSPVTDANELEWLKAVSPGGVDVSSLKLKPEPRFLHIWFSHPAFTRTSFTEISLFDDVGNPIKLGGQASIAGGAQDENERNGNLGWSCWTLSPGEGTNIPSRVTVRLRYAVGALERTEEVSPYFSGAMSLEGDSQLNAVGQNVPGMAFVAIAVDEKKMQARQFDVVAIAKDGREIPHDGYGRSGPVDGGVRAENFEFYIPITDVAKFIIGTRPIRTNEWKGVVLPKN